MPEREGSSPSGTSHGAGANKPKASVCVRPDDLWKRAPTPERLPGGGQQRAIQAKRQLWNRAPRPEWLPGGHAPDTLLRKVMRTLHFAPGLYDPTTWHEADARRTTSRAAQPEESDEKLRAPIPALYPAVSDYDQRMAFSAHWIIAPAWLSVTPMPKLSYFDFPASRGEECRLALYAAGVAFEDDRIPGPEWPTRKEQTPYGSLPTFEVEGRGVLAQSNAILVYIGREHDLHPRDNWLAARHEELLEAAEELRAEVMPTLRIKDPQHKQQAREELAAGYLTRWGTNVERRLRELGDGPFVGGAAIDVASIKLYIVARWFSSGNVDHIPKDVFADFTRLVGVERAVAEHPKIVEWYARAGATPPP